MCGLEPLTRGFLMAAKEQHVKIHKNEIIQAIEGKLTYLDI